MSNRASPGYTLVELASVLVLLAVGASVIAPTARRLADRSAVVSAREEVVRAIGRTRAAAVASGGASVILRTRPPSARISAGGSSVRYVRLGDGVTVELPGGRDSTVLRFDALGIGRFASGSITIRRGAVVGGVVVASYGRVRRR